MKIKEYPPVLLSNKLTSEIPNLHEKLSDVLKLQEKMKWDQRCYLPIGGCYVLSGKDSKSIFKAHEQAVQLAAILPWRISKEVFKIDPEIEYELCRSAYDSEIPSKLLMNLPYQCIYIETNHLELQEVNTFNLKCPARKFHGFFVHLEHDINTDEHELRFLFLTEDGNTFPTMIHINQKSISQNLDKVEDIVLDNISRTGLGIEEEISNIMNTKEYRVEINRLQSQALQIVLYILSANNDIQKSPKPIKRKKTSSPNPKVSYKEIREWDVGYRIGSSLRKNRTERHTDSESESREYRKGTAKSPHMRRGHFHAFWTGPKDSENRKIILKWLPPIPVNMDFENEMPVVFHNVIDENKK